MTEVDPMDLQSRFLVAGVLLFAVFSVLANADPYYDFYGFTGLAVYNEQASQAAGSDAPFIEPTTTPSLWPSPSPTAPSNATNRTGKVWGYTLPSGALMYLDGNYVGLTNVMAYNVLEGPHVTAFHLDGYADYTQEFYLTANTVYSVVKYLEPLNASPSPSPSPAPSISPSPQPSSIILHRTTRNCANDQIIAAEQVFPVGPGTGYYNYKCRNRKQEQCYDDGTFDKYYDEWCEYYYATPSPSINASPSPSVYPSPSASPSVSPSPSPSPSPIVYDMTTFIHDDLDFNIDSMRNTTESSRFGSTNTSFLGFTGPKKVTPYMTQVLAPAAGMPSNGHIIYPAGATNTYENQNVFLFAYTAYDETAKALQAKYAKTGYEAVFSDPIPLCLDTSKNFTGCNNTADTLKDGFVEITFLGDKFMIMDYALANGAISSVILGKPITRKTSFTPGEQATSPDGFVFRFVGIVNTDKTRAQFDVYNKDNQLIKRLYVPAGDSTTVTEANGVVVRVNAIYVAPVSGASIVDATLYSDQLWIVNDYEISGKEWHKNWKGRIVTGKVGKSEAISKIQLYNDVDQVYKVPVTQTLNVGESIDIIRGKPGYKFNFLGLESVDYDSLTFSILKGYMLALDTGQTVTGNILHIISGRPSAFQFGSRSVNDVFMVLESTSGADAGQIFYLNNNGQYSNYSTWIGSLPYFYSNDEYAVLYFNTSFNATPSIGSRGVLISIPELTESNVATVAFCHSNYHFNLFYDSSQDQFVNMLGSPVVDKIGYNLGFGVQNIASKETGFISYRGSVFTGISPTSAIISYARNIAHARYTLTRGAAVVPIVTPAPIVTSVPAGTIARPASGSSAPAAVGTQTVAEQNTQTETNAQIQREAIEAGDEPSVILCKDSDNGRAYSRKGTLTYGSQTFTDTCVGQLVTEYFCDGQSVGSEMYRCPGECSNGMCIASQQVDPITAGIRSFSEFMRKIIG